MPPAVTLPHMQRQTRRLLDIATPLPPVEGQGNLNRWLEGVTWQPRDCSEMTHRAPEACDDDDDLSSASFTVDCDTWGTGDPFRISQKFQGSMMDFPDKAFAADLLQDNYSRQVSAAFASELVSLMANAATEPTNGQAFADAAVPVSTAMALMDSTIASRLYGGIGYIHVPPLLLSRACFYDTVYLADDGNYRTPAGNIVISDAGYDNASFPFGGSSAELTDWIYCSGEVFYSSTVPQLFDPTPYDDRGAASTTAGLRRNRYEQWISGYGIWVFDDCPVSAVNATLVG